MGSIWGSPIDGDGLDLSEPSWVKAARMPWRNNFIHASVRGPPEYEMFSAEDGIGHHETPVGWETRRRVRSHCMAGLDFGQLILWLCELSSIGVFQQ